MSFQEGANLLMMFYVRDMWSQNKLYHRMTDLDEISSSSVAYDFLC